MDEGGAKSVACSCTSSASQGPAEDSIKKPSVRRNAGANTVSVEQRRTFQV